ncbi:MAG: hypothetical protein ACOCVK_02395 [bacterium]
MTEDRTTITELICDFIGYEKLEQICGELGGTRWSIPLRPPKHLRDERIKQEFDRVMVLKDTTTTLGVYNALGIKYGIHPRQVRRIVSSSEESDIQGP